MLCYGFLLRGTCNYYRPTFLFVLCVRCSLKQIIYTCNKVFILHVSDCVITVTSVADTGWAEKHLRTTLLNVSRCQTAVVIRK